MHKFFYISIFIFLPFLILGQSWQNVQERNVPQKGERKINPDEFLIALISDAEVKEFLWQAPLESSKSRNSETRLKVMLSDGSIDEFRIVEYKMMEEGLQKKFPDFKTFYGTSISNPSRKIRIDYTINGFRAVISDKDGKTYIDPYQTGDNARRIIYRRSDIQPLQEWVCETESKLNVEKSHDGENKFAGDCMLREYKLACAATGEYTGFHGGTVALGQAAIVTAFNRVNEIFEQDLGARMLLVANNDLLVFTNAATDPYSNTNGGAMLGQNQTTVDDIIGFANYDIGHVFSTGGGGVAYLQSLCNQDQSSQGISKAGGVTGQASPINDPFWIDYVAHEVGHQYGGNHTQNNSCQRNNNTAVEPGSASTIMGYAGICAPNVQNNSDPYFHSISIGEMSAHITNTNCAVVTDFGNTQPVVASLSNYTVPSSTFLVLAASASDADNDVLTYCWEQIDTEVATMPPLSTNTGGPAFRSLNPSFDSTRYLPNLDAILANQSSVWEVLPSVSRNMDFRITVRDQALIPGCTDEQDMSITVDGNSGPFLASESISGSTVNEGDNILFTWSVAGTDVAPVSCINVDILLSTDGGTTYPVTILANTANDGTETIVIPSNATATARIMVKCSDNIFFDINNADFEILSTVPSFTLSLSTDEGELCDNDTYVFDINTSSVNGFTTPINLSHSGLPVGANLDFGSNTIVPGTNTTATLSGVSGLGGVFETEIQGIAGSITKKDTITITISEPTNSPDLFFPSNTSTNVSIMPTLSWSIAPFATSYFYELSTSPGGVGLIDSGTVANPIAFVSTALTNNSQYYWRVRAINACGTSAFSAERSFTTIEDTEICTIFSDTDVPINLLDNAQTNAFIDVNVDGTITDIDVINLSGTHKKVNQLESGLFSPDGGTLVLLFGNICSGSKDFDINFDDEASPGAITCPPTGGLSYQPDGSLSDFDGQNPNGSWQLGILDNANGISGTLSSFELNICYEPLCGLEVTTVAQSGIGSLLAAIDCAKAGDTILISSALANMTIDIGNNELIIAKDLSIHANVADNIKVAYMGVNTGLEIASEIGLSLKGFTLESINSNLETISNAGNLVLEDMTISNKALGNELVNSVLGNLKIKGECNLIK